MEQPPGVAVPPRHARLTGSSLEPESLKAGEPEIGKVCSDLRLSGSPALSPPHRRLRSCLRFCFNFSVC
jgi:hypothetical protein